MMYAGHLSRMTPRTLFFLQNFVFNKSGRLAEQSVEQSWQIFTGARLTALAKFGGGVRGIAKQFILEFAKECAPTHFVDQGWHGLCGTHDEDQLATMLIVDGIGVTTTCSVDNVAEFGADARSVHTLT